MDELLQQCEEMLDAWDQFKKEMTLHVALDDLRESMGALRNEVKFQRNKIKAEAEAMCDANDG